MVSQKKHRFKDDKFNLDLTYITPRIIAMAYPASGMESLYRNKMNDVSDFLETRHKDKYYVINTSNRKYDYSKFKNRVIDIKWPNHHPCTFYEFSKLVLKVARILIETSQDTVVVVHCLGGKGRTGSLIIPLLTITGLFNSIKEANDYYCLKRGVNVTYPSQIRYMVQFRYYFIKGIKKINLFKKKFISFSLKSSNSAFFENNTFNLTMADYHDKDKVIFEKCFGALFEDINLNQIKPQSKIHKRQFQSKTEFY